MYRLKGLIFYVMFMYGVPAIMCWDPSFIETIVDWGGFARFAILIWTIMFVAGLVVIFGAED